MTIEPAAMPMRKPIARRLALLTASSAVGGILFVPFIIAGSGSVSHRDALSLWILFPLGSAIFGALCAWGGLIAGDRAGLPMPILRAWELRQPQEHPEWSRMVLVPMMVGALIAIAALLGAREMGLPRNPGGLAARLLTIPFAAVVTEIFAHLLILSTLALWLKNRWVAILLSSIVFTAVFHGQSIGPLAVTLFALALNFILSTFTGWAYTKYGFVAAILMHAVAHGIVLGLN